MEKEPEDVVEEEKEYPRVDAVVHLQPVVAEATVRSDMGEEEEQK